jgi:hypothetical protein
MGKCVIERPRHGSRSAWSAKARHYGKIVEYEDGPEYDGFTRLPVSRKQEGYHKNLGSKSFSDVLGPLHGYLLNSCGRPWDDVYSEIAYHIGRMTSPGISHIKEDHLDVAIHTFRDGAGDLWYCENGVLRVGWRFTNGQFYVDPDTGLLAQGPYRRHRFPTKPTDVDVHALTPESEHRLINGIWYYQRFTESVDRTLRHTLRGRQVYSEEIVRTVVYKRQLGKADLKKAGLKNGVQRK